MPDPNERMLDKSIPPDDMSVAGWLGTEGYEYWRQIVEFIETNYPGVFQPDWLFGGKKHGWGLRYKKSKSFCTLIPERGRVLIVIVFGVVERGNVESILPELASHTRRDYETATNYHDGKWLALAVDNDDTLFDVKRLLAIKRRPLK
ncbi:MAG: DUF3788 domain-containing protein [Armatimonadota bacterium]|nr:DUF3788 domain-containing protein [bacterium]